MASTDKTPPNMARLQELADAWERGEALKLLPAEVEDEIFDALPWLLARERELTEALEGLRSAWNAHMARCTLPAVAGMTDGELFAKLDEWKNAPSDTASGGAVLNSEEPSE